MGSRIRENVQHFFECFCEVVPPAADGKDAWIIQQYPYTYKDEEVLKSVSKFAYPYKFENSVIQHYSFVLTDIESKWTFGFCRHDPRSETAIVVLSYLPWHQAFYKFLDNIAVLMHSRETESLNEFLSSVYKTRLAGPGKKFTVPFNKGENTFSIECPQPIAHQLPSIPENRNLTEYYNAVDTTNMMIVFASMLYERRIIFTSKKLTRLSACVQSANDLLYPMIWQHIFIPVLPMAFRDYLLAPMPFLIGVPDEVMKEVSRSDIGDVVILDADNNTIETPFDDLHSLPTEVVNSLKKQLKNKSALLGDGVSRAFLRALVQLIGGYRDALSFGDKATFDENKFFETRPSSLQPFLKEMLHLQIFRQFIEERLEILGAGLGFTDQFETEVSIYSEKSSSKLKQQYKEWSSTMKKEGTAFFKNVKDKANPAVKSAVKTVKDSGKGMKSAYKGLRSKLKDNPTRQIENGLESSSFDKPRSAPNSPTGKRRQLPFSVPANAYRKDASLSLKGSIHERSYSPLNPLSQPLSPDVPDHLINTESPSLDIPQMDLMTEMKDLLKLRLDTPPVDRSLKPVRSLESFKTPQLSSPPYSPPSRLFLPVLKSSQETQNLLLQSPDDVFSSPPVPPRPHFKPTTTPFVVGGGRAENGRPVFLVANEYRVDVVRLSPPANSPRKKKQDDTEDLIRLDSSSSDFDDFDPLKSSLSTSMPNTTSNTFNFQFDLNDRNAHDYNNRVPISVTNPLYNYENHHIGATTNGSSSSSMIGGSTPFLMRNSSDRETVDLLQEYGLDFSRFPGSKFDGVGTNCDGGSSSSKVNTKKEWTKFE